MTCFTRHLRRFLTAHRPRDAHPLFAREPLLLTRAALLVRVFYLAMFYILLDQSNSWPTWLTTTTYNFLWPLQWLTLLNPHHGILLILVGSLFSTLLAGVFPTYRLPRILTCLGMLEFDALFNSFDVLTHGLHAWIWVSFLFIFLPTGPSDAIAQSRRATQRYLRVFWSAQAALLLFYSLSGSFKLLGILVQIHRHQINALMPAALPELISMRLLEGSPQSPHFIGPFIINHPCLAWPMELSALYLELFSFAIAFRPALHRMWGLAMVLLHLGIYFTMTILFSWHAFLAALLLIASPFAPEQFAVREAVFQLPVFAGLSRLIRSLPRFSQVARPATTAIPSPPSPQL
jgi:hypothetical protein